MIIIKPKYLVLCTGYTGRLNDQIKELETNIGNTIGDYDDANIKVIAIDDHLYGEGKHIHGTVDQANYVFDKLKANKIDSYGTIVIYLDGKGERYADVVREILEMEYCAWFGTDRICLMDDIIYVEVDAESG